MMINVTIVAIIEGVNAPNSIQIILLSLNIIKILSNQIQTIILLLYVSIPYYTM